MSSNPNETIINMITNLKPPEDGEMNNFEFNTPLKRPHSSASSVSSSNTISSQMSSSRASFDGPAPSKKAKFELSYLGSPREIRRLRADLVEARNTILRLETRIESMHSIRKNLELVFDDEAKTLRRQHEYDQKTIDELEKQLQVIRKREADLKKELMEAKSKSSTIKLETDEKIEELEKSLSDIKTDAEFITLQENGEIASLRRRVLELEDSLEGALQDAECNKKLASDLEKKLAEKNAVERELDLKSMALQKAKLQIKDLEYEKENYVEFQEQSKTQAHKLATYPELERERDRLKEENIRLKDEVKNKLILEEEVHNLKTRLVTFKEQEKKLSNLQMQQVQLEMYLEEWKSVARGICESSTDLSTPRLLRGVVERLQQQEITLTSEKVELESKLNTVTHEAKVARSELEKAQKLLSDQKITIEHKQNLIHRMQKKLLLVSRERDSYRSQLDSYEKDLTMCLNTTGPMGSSAANQVQSQKERIENQERIIEGYREMLAKLEADLHAIQPDTIADVPIRSEQISRLQKELDQLRVDNKKLRDRKDQLEMQLEAFLVGNDSVLGGQVFHQEKNPLLECITQRENHIEKLELEVEKLRKKLKNREESLEVSKISDASILNSKEVQALKEQNKTYEIQYERLKEFMKTSMQEFRNVVYMLLGYKVDRTSNLYKLTSTYAERAEDQLCFQLNSEGTLNLLENEFSSTLEELVNLHLRHQKSIPVFLSAITIDLFNNKTMSTQAFPVD